MKCLYPGDRIGRATLCPDACSEAEGDPGLIVEIGRVSGSLRRAQSGSPLRGFFR